MVLGAVEVEMVRGVGLVELLLLLHKRGSRRHSQASERERGGDADLPVTRNEAEGSKRGEEGGSSRRRTTVPDFKQEEEEEEEEELAMASKLDRQTSTKPAEEYTCFREPPTRGDISNRG